LIVGHFSTFDLAPFNGPFGVARGSRLVFDHLLLLGANIIESLLVSLRRIEIILGMVKAEKLHILSFFDRLDFVFQTF